MKKLSLVIVIALSLGCGIQAYAEQAKNKILAANCASNCSSCWDQCSKSDDCGVGFNCATTPCGNRCQKQ